MSKLKFLLFGFLLTTNCESQTKAENIDSATIYDSHQQIFDVQSYDTLDLITKTLIIGDSEAGRCFPRINLIASQREQFVLDYKTSSTIQHWANKKFESSINTHNPNRVIVFLGTNNYAENKLPDIKQILNVISKNSIECVWVGPVAVRGNKKIIINDLLRDAVQPTCKYFDTINADIPLEDGIHPGKIGIDKWLTLIWSLSNSRTKN